jgi:hypothetical protein
MDSGGIVPAASQTMALVSLIWLITTPLATAVAIARSPRGNRLVARCYWPCLALGWIGVGMLVVGGVLLEDVAAAVALGVGAPLAGLSVWVRGSGGGGDDGPPPENPEPTPPGWDWERFYTDLRDFTDARGGAARGREPSPV